MTTSTLTANEARRAARNAGALALASIASMGVQFVWQLILAAWLGASDYGIYGTVTALFSIATALPAFGMGVIVIRDVARAPERVGNYFTATLFIQTVLALVAYVVVNAAAASLSYSDEIRAFVALAGISLIVDASGNLCNSLLLGREQMVGTSVIETGHVFVRIALAWLALTAGFGLFGVYIVTILCGVGRSALLAATLLRSGVYPQFPLDRTITKTLLIDAAPLALMSFLALAYQQSDKLITTKLIGQTGTGYLTAAFVVIFGIVNLISTTVLTATFPLMSRAYGDGRAPLFGFIVEKLTFYTVIVSFPVSLTISLFASQIMQALLGVKFSPTADVLRILIWFTLVTMVGNVLAQGWMIQNRQRLLLVVRVGGLLVNIVLNLILLPTMGVNGAALASVSAETLTVLAMVMLFRATGLEWKRVAPSLLRLAVLGLVTALTMIAIGALNAILGGVCGLAIFAVGVLFGRILRADDWDLLYRLAAAMPGSKLILKYWRRDVVLNW